MHLLQLWMTFIMMTLTQFQVTLTWDQCDLCNPDLKDMLNALREQIDKIEEQFFSCCPECPAGYQAVSGHCYMLSHDQLPWQQAMDSCVMQGARLVSIETNDKQEALSKFVKKQTGDYAVKTAYYTSGNFASGRWAWGQGQEAKRMTFLNWAHPEKVLYQQTTKSCLEWRFGNGWNVIPCSISRYYICEHISDTDITPSDYTDYMAAAKMNVEYLQGQGLDDGQGQHEVKGQGQTNEVNSNNQGQWKQKDTIDAKEKSDLSQVAPPIKTTEAPPGGTTMITPRNKVTKSYQEKHSW